MNRRSFLGSIFAAATAPAFVKIGSLMAPRVPSIALPVADWPGGPFDMSRGVLTLYDGAKPATAAEAVGVPLMRLFNAAGAVLANLPLTKEPASGGVVTFGAAGVAHAADETARFEILDAGGKWMVRGDASDLNMDNRHLGVGQQVRISAAIGIGLHDRPGAVQLGTAYQERVADAIRERVFRAVAGEDIPAGGFVTLRRT
jgi:hypothetical protein